jgi:hypothetical protein
MKILKHPEIKKKILTGKILKYTEVFPSTITQRNLPVGSHSIKVANGWIN